MFEFFVQYLVCVFFSYYSYFMSFANLFLMFIIICSKCLQFINLTLHVFTNPFLSSCIPIQVHLILYLYQYLICHYWLPKHLNLTLQPRYYIFTYYLYLLFCIITLVIFQLLSTTCHIFSCVLFSILNQHFKFFNLCVFSHSSNFHVLQCLYINQIANFSSYSQHNAFSIHLGCFIYCVFYLFYKAMFMHTNVNLFCNSHFFILFISLHIALITNY